MSTGFSGKRKNIYIYGYNCPIPMCLFTLWWEDRVLILLQITRAWLLLWKANNTVCLTAFVIGKIHGPLPICAIMLYRETICVAFSWTTSKQGKENPVQKQCHQWLELQSCRTSQLIHQVDLTLRTSSDVTLRVTLLHILVFFAIFAQNNLVDWCKTPWILNWQVYAFCSIYMHDTEVAVIFYFI